MKEIPLTQGKFALVDDEDYDYLMQWKWHADRRGCTFYARKTNKIKGGGVDRVYMHRLILKVSPSILIDHINRNGLDNRKINLRECCASENLFNTGKYCGVSKYKGVSKKTDRPRTKPWRAYFRLNGKQFLVGVFKTELEAAVAYDREIVKHRGSFALLNFPELVSAPQKSLI